ncbi:MAG TPA: 3-dehydroquinate synthase [Actinomycetota bacterium]|jgi:3-dehydroquinate synthase|nr:3-dehydroquinate synthase [Actinomycetota bacterium]
MERVRVAVPGRGYDVTVGTGLLSEAAAHLPELPGAERAFVVADGSVAQRYIAPLVHGLKPLGIRAVHLGVPEGEEAKSLQTMTALQRQLAIQGAHRHDPIVALGGGAVGDLAGFVAATYMRGVPVVQVPTTLLAQVDAAIGGKTAVNLPEGKNLVGAFHQPVAVIADITTLATLPDREYRSGLAEVAKYALAIDPELLGWLERDPATVLSRDLGALEELVTRCVRAKAVLVGEDERDAGARLHLNYGHTLGHALERLDAFAGRSHGEAVAIGMTFAARLAEAMGIAPAGLAARHVRLLASLGLESGATLPGAEAILAAMRMDKKYRGGIRFVLLEDVGRPVVVDGVPGALVRDTLAGMGAAEAAEETG